MKIYMVIADNGLDYEEHEQQNHGAFLTKEAAEKYLFEEIDNEYARIKPRYEELGEKVWKGTPTEEERVEYDALCEKWYYYPGTRTEYFIKEYEILG